MFLRTNLGRTHLCVGASGSLHLYLQTWARSHGHPLRYWVFRLRMDGLRMDDFGIRGSLPVSI